MVLLRYFVSLPEPIRPQELHQDFIRPLQDTEASVSPGFNSEEIIALYQGLVNKLPPLNRQLFLYMLDLLAVFASMSDQDLMTAGKLAGIFVPCVYMIR